jgi:prophage regulatory protein
VAIQSKAKGKIAHSTGANQGAPNHSCLPDTGFIRLSSILAPKGPIPVSKSTWREGVRQGRFPKPVKLGPRITAWRDEDIRTLIARGCP